MSSAAPADRFDLPSAATRQATGTLLAGGVLTVPLPWATLAVTGSDAEKFLQGQVTTDMREVAGNQSRLGCLLNLKGRVQASFRAIAVADGYLLLLPADQLETTRARLAKYAVFSKVVLTPQARTISGLLGAGAIDTLTRSGWDWPAESQQVSTRDGALLVRLPGRDRALLISADADTTATATPEALAAWEAGAVRAGEYMVPAAASEQLQPQEIDYHTLQGVSYQKGCYLGQEIVARLYFRGQLKSALTWLQADWPADAGSAPQRGQHLTSGGSKVGEVIQAVWPDEGRLWLLAQLRLESGPASLRLDDGRELALTALSFER